MRRGGGGPVFQQPSVSHKEVMQEIELFGREVLPQIKQF